MEKTGLTLQQEFAVKALESQITNANAEDLKLIVLAIYRLHFHTQNQCKSLIANSWGLAPEDVEFSTFEHDA